MSKNIGPITRCPECSAKIRLRGDGKSGDRVRLTCPKCRTRMEVKLDATADVAAAFNRLTEEFDEADRRAKARIEQEAEKVWRKP